MKIVRAQCALERGTRHEARQHYLALRATGFKRPLDGQNVSVRLEARLRMSSLCFELGSSADAAMPYPTLRLRARHFKGSDNVCWGSVSRTLGELAEKLGRTEAARRHYVDALELNERIGHRPELVRTRMGLARVLASIGRPEDATDLIAQARAEAASIGMFATFVAA